MKKAYTTPKLTKIADIGEVTQHTCTCHGSISLGQN